MGEAWGIEWAGTILPASPVQNNEFCRGVRRDGRGNHVMNGWRYVIRPRPYRMRSFAGVCAEMGRGNHVMNEWGYVIRPRPYRMRSFAGVRARAEAFRPYG